MAHDSATDIVPDLTGMDDEHLARIKAVARLRLAQWCQRMTLAVAEDDAVTAAALMRGHVEPLGLWLGVEKATRGRGAEVLADAARAVLTGAADG